MADRAGHPHRVEPARTPEPLSLARADLTDQVEQTLHRGGWGNPDLLLVRVAGRRVVVKDFAPRRAWIRLTLGRWMTAREQRAYRRLAGIEIVPSLLCPLDDLAFVLEYRPGDMLTRSLAGSLPAGFLAELEHAVSTMHARGVVHLDLRHRSNILAGADGHPVVLDFASSICFEPGGLLMRWLMPCLTWIDWRALRKWREKLGA